MTKCSPERLVEVGKVWHWVFVGDGALDDVDQAGGGGRPDDGQHPVEVGWHEVLLQEDQVLVQELEQVVVVGSPLGRAHGQAVQEVTRDRGRHLGAQMFQDL